MLAIVPRNLFGIRNLDAKASKFQAYMKRHSLRECRFSQSGNTLTEAQATTGQNNWPGYIIDTAVWRCPEFIRTKLSGYKTHTRILYEDGYEAYTHYGW